nr:Lrp/AsnC ligand binding domain-containing protein [Ornithinimicrobium cryptoxanthini]
MIKVEVAHIPEAAQAIAEIDGITEVYSVTGNVDLIAVARVARHEDFADVIADRLNKVQGVQETETHIAFRTYSAQDLEAAFSIGLDE